jgi:hypothetical protein
LEVDGLVHTDKGLLTRKAWTIKEIGTRFLTVTGKRTVFSRGRYEVLLDSYKGDRLAEIKGSLAEARDGMRNNQEIWREMKLLNDVAKALRDS